MATTRMGMVATLAVSEFRALWLAEAISVAGDQLAKVALALAVYSRTGSALLSAVVYALTFLPALAGGLGLSQLADRYPRRTVMVTCASLQAVLVGLMAVPGMPLAIMCVLQVGVSLAQAPALAAQNPMTRIVIDDDDLYYRSQDLRGVTFNTVQLLGLASSGLLVAGVGVSTTLLIDALTFACAAVLVRFGVQHRPAANGGQPTAWSAGFRYVFGQAWVRTLLGLSCLVGLAVVPEGLAAPMAHQLGAPSGAIGWLLAADPLGYIVGTFVLSRYVSTTTRQRIMGGLAAVPLVVLLCFVFHPPLPAVLVLLAVAGATGVYQITVFATLNSWVPDEVRSSAFGVVRTGLRVSQGLGVAAGGVLAQVTGSADNAIAIAAALGVLLAIPLAVRWRRVYRPAAEKMQNV